nr:MAG TPA: hypothetical protein [Ackermannviridae sp.]DAU17372.1 MAG TPA: hypothetical protein [Caudoviricetes sp.]
MTSVSNTRPWMQCGRLFRWAHTSCTRRILTP